MRQPLTRSVKMMLDGIWHGDLPDTPELVRRRAEGRRTFRSRVTADGAAGYSVAVGR